MDAKSINLMVSGLTGPVLWYGVYICQYSEIAIHVHNYYKFEVNVDKKEISNEEKKVQ